MSITASPLCWPDGWKRTPPMERPEARFHRKANTTGPGSWQKHQSLTISQAIQRVLAELKRMGISRDDCVISTNLVLRLDGLPRSDQKRPHDPGAAVYWEDMGARRVMAIDRYDTVEGNLAAIAATLDAMRAIERHGGAVILERAFTGFAALSAPGAVAARDWWQVLGVEKTDPAQVITAAYRYLRSVNHPDKLGTGDATAFHDVQKAYEQAVAEGRT